MLWGSSFLVLSIWCSVCFLYLCRCIFPEFGEFFFYDIVGELVYAIDLGFFSLFYACNSEIWFFIVPHNSYVFLSCILIFSHFLLISSWSATISLTLDILPSACFINLVRLSFLIVQLSYWVFNPIFIQLEASSVFLSPNWILSSSLWYQHGRQLFLLFLSAFCLCLLGYHSGICSP